MKKTVAALAAVTAALASAAAAPAAEQVIVKYAPGTTAQERGVAERLAGVTRTLGRVAGVGARVVRVTGDAEAAAARLNRSRAVLYAEPDRILRALRQVPNDPRFGELYGIDNGNDADLDGPEAWTTAFAGSWPSTGGPAVGIVDTGIDQAHEDLAGKTALCAGVRSFGLFGLFGGDPTVVADRCADDNDHGTHVAGTIAAIANNGVGVAGVAFNSRLAICKALSSAGSGSTSGVANCITYLADNGAKVISLSLGGGSSTTLQQAVANAYRNGAGALIVAAAGNDGNSAVNYPAGYAEAVSVAATDRNDRRASFSNANADVEVAAAGVDVLSTRRGGGYVAFSGTSMATPHAAGVAALILSRNPGFTAAQVRSRLTATADDLGAAGRDPQYGFGRVNAARAVQ